METKLCKKCNEVKPLNRFTKATNIKSGYRSPCKDCNNAYYAARRVTQYEKVREYERKFHTERRLKYEYAMTVDELNQRRIKQEYKCAICLEPSKLVVDHCHRTKRVRGLLCNSCNLGLGLFKDNPKILESAIKYLEKKYG